MAFLITLMTQRIKMKQTILSLTLLFGILASPLAQAQGKIASIDLQKVFDGYWKTKQISDNLQSQGKDYQTNREKLILQYQAVNEEYRKLRESASDQAVSASEREKRGKEADTKLVQVRSMEKDITDYDNTTRTQIAETQARMKKNIVRDIRETIGKIAKKDGFAMVIDTAAEARTETPIILYNDGSNDVTDKVLSLLNAEKNVGK
jgi:outer membrane protein